MSTLDSRLAQVERQMMARRQARAHARDRGGDPDPDPAVVRESLYAQWLAAAGITPEQYAAAGAAEQAYARELFAEELRAEVRRRYPARFAPVQGEAQAWRAGEGAGGTNNP